MANDHNLSGLFVPNITPTDSQGNLDESTLRDYIEWLIGKGIHGLYPNGSTGEFLRFTPLERRRVMEVVVDQVKGRIPILAGAAETNVKETIDACNYYGDLGVRAVAIVSPYYYRLTSDGVYEFFREIATQVRVDVTLYNIPMFASPIDVETISRLAMDCPRIVGIKDSSGDLPNMMRMIARIRPQRSDFRFLTGWDAALAPMLIAGCDGGTNACTGVIPELTLAIYNAVKSKNIDRAMELQQKLIPLFDAMIAVPEFPEGFRRSAAIRGWKLGLSRQPVSKCSTQAADQAEAKLKVQIDSMLTELS